MSSQTKKFQLKSIAYICIIILVLNFSLARAEEETVFTETASSTEEGAEAVVLADEFDIATEEASSTEADSFLADEFDEVAAEEASSTSEADIENISEIATGTEENLQDFEGEPIIFVFNSLEDENCASTSPVVSVSDENSNGTSTASSTDSVTFFETENSSSTEFVSSSTEESFVDSASPQTSSSGAVSSVVFDQPEIIAQWQMLVAGSDDSADVGAQILPSGEYKVDKKYSVCAVVGGDLTATGSILANVSYPENIAFDKAQTRGCGQQKSEVELNKIAKEEAIALVCDQIRNNNNNLLAWNKNEKAGYVYDYEKLCGLDGFLAENTALLFCAESSLAYDDPAGEYEVIVTIKDGKGNTGASQNILQYLELTTFENDFSNFQYGKVNLNELKVLQGDSIWGNSFYPTVRNTGNTCLQIKIQQNDFNLGTTNGVWNLEYMTRVGENAEWLSYFPEQTAYLKNFLNLGQTTNIDFAILIKKYPEDENQSAFSGEMVLSAEKIPSLTCQK